MQLKFFFSPVSSDPFVRFYQNFGQQYGTPLVHAAIDDGKPSDEGARRI
jgi:hypothetical protein